MITLHQSRDKNYNVATNLTTEKCQCNTVSDKLQIVKFVRQNGNHAAKHKFGVSESHVRLWQRSKEDFQKISLLKRANCGKQAVWLELEIDLLARITERRKNGLAILLSFVWMKALRFAKEENYNIPVGVSKGSNHWCQGFMKKNGLSLQQKTILAQWLPNDSGEKFALFHHFIINHHKKQNYPLHLIANMEALLTFNIPPNCNQQHSWESLKNMHKRKSEELSYSCVALLWKGLISPFIHTCERLVSDKTSHIFRHFSTISLYNLISVLAS